MFQTTLFGSRVKKSSFFPNMGQDAGPYYAVIEALWSLDPSENSKSFLARAQKLWKEYENSDVALQELLAKASSIGRQQDAVRIRPFVCTSESVKHVPATDAGTVGMCDDTSGPSGCKTFESTSSVASAGNDRLSFCNDLGVTA